MHRGKRVGVVVLSIALGVGLAACEPDKAESAGRAVKATGGSASSDGAGGPAESAAEPTSTTTTEAPTTTTTQAPTTTTTAPPPPPPPTTTTAKPKPTTTTTTAAAKPASKCHSSYTRTCIPPDVSDADCAGGSGNGPYYVREKNIGVVGPDVFDLDGNDNDGIGCES